MNCPVCDSYAKPISGFTKTYSTPEGYRTDRHYACTNLACKNQFLTKEVTTLKRIRKVAS